MIERFKEVLAGHSPWHICVYDHSTELISHKSLLLPVRGKYEVLSEQIRKGFCIETRTCPDK